MAMVPALLLIAVICAYPPSIFSAASMVVPTTTAIPGPPPPVLAMNPNDVKPIDTVVPTNFVGLRVIDVLWRSLP